MLLKVSLTRHLLLIVCQGGESAPEYTFLCTLSKQCVFLPVALTSAILGEAFLALALLSRGLSFDSVGDVDLGYVEPLDHAHVPDR